MKHLLLIIGLIAFLFAGSAFKTEHVVKEMASKKIEVENTFISPLTKQEIKIPTTGISCTNQELNLIYKNYQDSWPYKDVDDFSMATDFMEHAQHYYDISMPWNAKLVHYGLEAISKAKTTHLNFASISFLLILALIGLCSVLFFQSSYKDIGRKIQRTTSEYSEIEDRESHSSVSSPIIKILTICAVLFIFLFTAITIKEYGEFKRLNKHAPYELILYEAYSNTP